MKKLLGIVVLILLFGSNAYSNNEELYWCGDDTWGSDVRHGIPVWVIPDKKQMIFLEELKFADGKSWESAFGRKNLKINKNTDAFYTASGEWVDPEVKSLNRGKVDVILYKEYMQLLTKVKGVDKDFNKWTCERFKIN